MVPYLLFTAILTILIIVGYRYSFPYPLTEYSGLFLLLFSFGFFPRLFSDRWGRAMVVIGAIILSRVGSFGNILTTIPEWTTLHPLFLGASFGILVREFYFNPGEDRGRRILRRQNHIFPWKNPELGILGFLAILILERFLSYHPWSWESGILLTEGFYFESISYRQAFQLSWMVFDTTVPVIWYFVLEWGLGGFMGKGEADGKNKSSSNNNPTRYWITGLGVAFSIQMLILFIQTWIQPSAFMQDTNMSVLAGRPAGLFRDSGSASWMFPTMALFLMHSVRKMEMGLSHSLKIIYTIAILTGTFLAGWQLGRAFWFILLPSLFAIGMFLLWKKEIHAPKWLSMVYKLLILVSILLVFFSIFWFGGNQTKIPALHRAGIELRSLSEGTSLEEIESRRVLLMKASWELFSSSPLFGTGWGAMITHLKDPNSQVQSKPLDGFVDSPPNFFLGLLGEVGILGFLVVGFYILVSIYIRKNGISLCLLILPLLTGYQIVHPDGGFFLLFLVLAGSSKNPYDFQKPYSERVYRERWVYLFLIVSLGISLHFLVRALLQNQ